MSQVHAATIAGDAQVEGTFVGRDLTVLGRFQGDLRLSGTLRVGRAGQVLGQVRAEAAEIEGVFEGSLHVTRLAFGENADARGTFSAPHLAMREGARVEGAINVEPTAVAASTDEPTVGASRPVPRAKSGRKATAPVAARAATELAADTDDLEALEEATRPDVPAAPPA
jgi:cytoskeletal protein CcmA (bactofilin family)